MKHLLIFAMATLVLWCAVPVAPGAAKMLSTQRDTRNSDAATAAKHSDEPTAFWGLSNALGGGRDGAAASTAEALPLLRRYAARPGVFYDAAFILAVRHRLDLVEELSKSRTASDTALAAAALTTIELGKHLQADRDAGRIAAVHYGADGAPLKHKAKNKPKKKPKPGAKGGAKEASQITPMLTTLLSSRDPLTQSLAIQAAAYGRHSSVQEAVRAITPLSEAALGTRLFYEVMIGQTPAAESINRTANQTLQAAARRKGKHSAKVGFGLGLPGVSFVCQAIGELGDPSHAAILISALSLPDPRIRIDAARAMAKLQSEQFLLPLNKAVMESGWPVLPAVCRAVAVIPSEKMMPGLTRRLANEKGRMRQDLVYALSAIAGEQHGTKAKDWMVWWNANGKTFKPNPEASRAYVASTRVQDVDVPGLGFFYGLQIISDHMCYVIDSSASMRGDRIASLKENLTQSIGTLADHVYYNLVDFGGDVEVLSPEGLTGDKNRGKSRVYDMDLSVATRSYCGLRQGAILNGVDTLYFLSDGAPAMDSMRTWDDIIRGMLLMTRYYPIAIYGIDFDPSVGNQASMIRLADDNIGLHESIAVGPAAEDFDLGGAGKKKPAKKRKK